MSDSHAPAVAEHRKAGLDETMHRPVTWVLAVAAGAVAAYAGPAGVVRPLIVVTAVVTTLLAVVDLAVRRLPNAVVLPLGLATLAYLTAVAVVAGTGHQLLGAFLGAVGLGVIFLLLALLRPGGMGGGDVKLAAVLGLTGGWYGIHAWIWVMMAPFVIGGSLAVVGLAVRRLSRTATLAFGPALAAGYVLAASFAF